MNGRLKTAIVTVAMVIIGLWQTAAIHVRAETASILWDPYCTGTVTQDRVIHWKTAEPTWGIVQYAPEEHLRLHGSYTELAVDSALRPFHHVTLNDLQPETTYAYRVWIVDADVSQASLQEGLAGDAASWLQENGAPSQDYRFRTLGDAPFSFVVYGDSQEQTPWFTQMERHKLVADYIAQEQDLAFVMHLGDLTYDPEDMAGWDMFFEAAREMLGRNTLYTVMGNHENNSPTYSELFGMPSHYSFHAGDARFTVLDTNSWADLNAQGLWLEEALRPPAKWDFVFYHHPAFSSDSRNYGGWERSTTAWGDAFARAGVTAIFSGHTHAYERYLVQGIQHLVVGTGGGALSDLSADAPAGLQNRLSKTLGYARVTVDRQVVTIEMIQVARISDDNRRVEQVYPFGSVYETVTIEPDAGTQHPVYPAGSFQVAPPSLSLEVESNGSQRFSMRVTSSHDATVRVGTESLPFEVRPSVIKVDGSEQGQKFEFELLGNAQVPEGTYEGKLTFLRDADNNVTLGVKVRTVVLQTGGQPRLLASLGDNLWLIIAVVFVVSLNIGGYVLYRKYQARLAHAEGKQ
ncbi:MAG: metallophosphoesterase family protein [Chloroflexi bacterium]|nr:metallophosphoesterase family protein [Chloroflexota bacterium]